MVRSVVESGSVPVQGGRRVWAPAVGGTRRRAGFALPWAAESWADRLGPRRRNEPGGPAGALGQKPGRERVSLFLFIFQTFESIFK